MTTRFEQLLGRLLDEGVEFIVVGGFAATVHGALRTTLDLDVVYRRTPESLLRVIAALERDYPYPRGAPAGLPFRWEVRTLEFGSNFTLRTSLGLIDLLGSITGGGDYEALLPFARPIVMFGRECRCLDLEKLIDVKRAAGRPKDFEAIAELELLRDKQSNNRPAS